MEQIVVKKEPVDNFDGTSTSADQETPLTSGIVIKQEIKELDDGDKSMVYDESGVKEESEMSADVEDDFDGAEQVVMKFEAEDETFLDLGYEINDGDEESDNCDDDEDEGKFSEEDDKNSLRNEGKDGDEDMFETKIEVENHGVKCGDMSGNKKLFKCEICFKEQRTKRSLFDHKKYIHGKDKLEKFKCDKCDYVTVIKTNIKKHLKIHDKESYLKCQFCHYKTSDMMSLNGHLLSKHKEENKTKITNKIHECSNCSYSTVRKSSYNKHISRCLKLKNVKYYECHLCPYKTNNKYNLTPHIKIQHKTKLNCLFCKYESDKKRSLDNHILAKHSHLLNESNENFITAKVHVCQHCNFKTTKLFNFKTHLKSKHCVK